MMNIHRIRRQSKYDESDLCDFCDKPISAGFEFMGEDVSGPRGGFLHVCDGCLKATKSDPTGYLVPAKPNPNPQWSDHTPLKTEPGKGAEDNNPKPNPGS